VKLSCMQDALARGMSIVGRAVATKTTLPVVMNVLLATENGRLKLAATNLEVGITCWVAANVEEEGAITVPSRLFAEIISSLPKNQPVDLTLETRTQTLKVHCASYEASLKGIDFEEFPRIPEVGDVAAAEVRADDLKQSINQVVFAAATDDSRPVLTGVLFAFEGEKLTLAAADGFRLAVKETPLVGSVAEPLTLLAPARWLAELGRILGDQNEPVQVMVTQNKSQALFHMKDVDLVSRLIDGTFPNYRQIIPGHWDNRVVLGKQDFEDAAKIASYVAKDAANVVKLQVAPGEELTPGKVVITAAAAEVGEAIADIQATVQGDGVTISFNAKFIADVLAVIDTAQVALELTSSSSPGVIKPVGKEDYVHVIMPMHTVR
jgi:DNA polymerase III subunit beta